MSPPSVELQNPVDLELSLIRILKATEAFLSKGRRTDLIRTQMNRIRERGVLKMNRAVSEYFKLTENRIFEGLDKDKEPKIGNAKEAEKFVNDLTDWKALEKEGEIIFKPAILEVLNDAGRAIVERKIAKQEERYDPIGIESVNWAEKHSANLIVQITDNTRAGIRAFIVNALKRGRSIPDIMRDIRPIVGLYDTLALAVGRYRTKLETDPKYAKLTAKQIDGRTERYSRRLHKYRQNMIARTETRMAFDRGTLQGYKQMGVELYDRIEDPECCEYCAKVMRGGPYTMAQASQFSFHPNCEGVWVAARG